MVSTERPSTTPKRKSTCTASPCPTSTRLAAMTTSSLTWCSENTQGLSWQPALTRMSTAAAVNSCPKSTRSNRSNGVEQRQWPNVHRTLEEDQAAGEAFFALLVRTMRERGAARARPHHQHQERRNR